MEAYIFRKFYPRLGKELQNFYYLKQSIYNHVKRLIKTCPLRNRSTNFHYSTQ
jgi:hypothetical protein